MFVIYKFTNDPTMRVKSTKYTEDKFIMIKDLFDSKDSLLVQTEEDQLMQQ